MNEWMFERRESTPITLFGTTASTSCNLNSKFDGPSKIHHSRSLGENELAGQGTRRTKTGRKSENRVTRAEHGRGMNGCKGIR